MPPETIDFSITQLQLNMFRNWVHNDKWWITASDILKDHGTEEWIHRTNKNPTWSDSETGEMQDGKQDGTVLFRIIASIR